MISVVQNHDVYEIKFPYDATLVNLVKQVPGRCWVNTAKHWTIPTQHLGLFLNQVKGTMYEDQVVIKSDEHINENASLDESTKIPNYDISNLKMFGHPYEHQKDFMKWALYRQNVQHNMHGFLLCDQQGLGKSLEATLLAVYNKLVYKFKRCLVICCVNTAKYHWYEDIMKHSENKYVPYILGTRISKRTGAMRADTGTAEKLEDLENMTMYGDKNGQPLPYFIIMNVEGVRGKQGKHYVISDRIIELVKSGEISMIAIDEIHHNASPSSANGKQLLRIKKYTESKAMWLPITGTLIISKPTDCFLPLKLVDGHRFNSFWSWQQKFCIYGGFGGHEIIGYRNIPWMKEMIDANMIRRLKKDVLDLPDKVYYDEYVENTPYQERLYNSIAQELYEQRDSIIRSLNPLSQFIRLRQANSAPHLVDIRMNGTDSKQYIKSCSKLSRLVEIVKEVHERGEKAVIFDNWVEPIKVIYKVLTELGYDCVTYTGEQNDSERNENKHRFMTDPKCTIILGTIGALGTMHTLTAANNAIFYNEPWTAADKEQAEDRIHRIGTNSDSVNIYTLLVKNTVDERVHNIVYRKQGISNFIVDDVDIHSNPELFDLLLSDTLKSKK